MHIFQIISIVKGYAMFCNTDTNVFKMMRNQPAFFKNAGSNRYQVQRIITARAVQFRPCIDIHKGKVKQIVGSSLSDLKKDGEARLQTNFESEHPSSWYASLYEKDNLTGGHVIMLGADSASRASARKALTAWPGGLQLGGSVNSDNASSWIDAGASHVIVTSFIFDKGVFMSDKLTELVAAVGKGHLVLDLSCRKSKEDGRYYVVTDRWQKFSQLVVDQATLEMLADSCDEFLVHGVDVEGMQLGIDKELVSILGQHSPIPVTYAGGARSISDLEIVKRAGGGRVDITVGSALDIFGGQLAYDDVVAWHNSQGDGGDGGRESSHVSVAAANQDDDGKMGMTQDDGTILYRF